MIGYHCPACGARPAITIGRFRCDCGAPLELDGDRAIFRAAGSGDARRPLVNDDVAGVRVRWALEYVSPTGSYKDRGAAALVVAAAAVGAERLVDDSSGNAGIALAAAGAHAGLSVRLVVPEDAAPEKLRIARALGATVVAVPGPRERAAAEAERDAGDGWFYASHAWSPFFVEGVASLAADLADSLDDEVLASIVVPCGNGGLVLGLDRGFRDLVSAGRLARRPSIVAVQADGVAPLARAFDDGAQRAVDGPWPGTMADGIRVARPARGAEVLRAVRESGGRFITVRETDIADAWRWLWSRGLPVEPTSAVVAAALRSEGPRLAASGGGIVGVLTGAGIKGPMP